MHEQVIPTVSTRLTFGDKCGRLGVRWSIGRKRYRVSPGLYRVGTPVASSPVLVTANYKLSFDVLRSQLDGIDAWILVLDTNGINVWCAAGEGTFGTEELVRRVEATHLAEVVSHHRLIVPQLGATGVAAHEVRRLCGFAVTFGPVRARDLPAFLKAGMRASDDMRRVSFTIGDRIELVGVEVVAVLKWFVLLALLIVLLSSGASIPERAGYALRRGAPILAGLLAGTVLVPIFLPWIPGRSFSLKGALVGALAVGATLALVQGASTTLGVVEVFLFGTVVASFFAMQFTGATTFTSPSGVEWEMKRALPVQIAAVVLAIGLAAANWIAS